MHSLLIFHTLQSQVLCTPFSSFIPFNLKLYQFPSDLSYTPISSFIHSLLIFHMYTPISRFKHSLIIFHTLQSQAVCTLTWSSICFSFKHYNLIRSLFHPISSLLNLISQGSSLIHFGLFLKGSVQRNLRGMLLYIIEKSSLRPIIAGHRILILLKGHLVGTVGN